MARISKAKFRNLRDTYAANKYFTVTAKNIEQLKIMAGDDIQIGDKLILRPMKMTDSVIAAMDYAGTGTVMGKHKMRLRTGTEGQIGA